MTLPRMVYAPGCPRVIRPDYFGHTRVRKHHYLETFKTHASIEVLLYVPFLGAETFSEYRGALLTQNRRGPFRVFFVFFFGGGEAGDKLDCVQPATVGHGIIHSQVYSSFGFPTRLRRVWFGVKSASIEGPQGGEMVNLSAVACVSRVCSLGCALWDPREPHLLFFRPARSGHRRACAFYHPTHNLGSLVGFPKGNLAKRDDDRVAI